MVILLSLSFVFLGTCEKGSEINIDDEKDDYLKVTVAEKIPINATHRLFHQGKEAMCFTFSYPVWIKYPDGSEKSVRSDQDIFDMLRKWNDKQIRTDQYPKLRKPFLVLLDQYSYTFVKTEEEFHTILNSCYENN